MTSLLVQSGFFNDRSKEIRIEAQSVVKKLNLTDKKVEIITSGLTNELSTKKIIKISLFMPKIENGLRSIDELSINQYAWVSSREKKRKKKKITLWFTESKKLKPWKLIRKNKDLKKSLKFQKVQYIKLLLFWVIIN